ncbi:hypothetical protein RhiJN_05037 [Ceratobasidium sp. AG-Ba]|nr:hypothetical protein RhiJN_05037 [Ceratobasidium sp. AG-Ba]
MPIKDQEVVESTREEARALEEVPRAFIGSSFTDSAVPRFRPPKIETHGASGLDVAPGLASVRLFDVATVTPSSGAFDGQGTSFDQARREMLSSSLAPGLRYDPTQFDQPPTTPSTQYDPVRFNPVVPVITRSNAAQPDSGPTTPSLARYDASPVASRLHASPVTSRYDRNPVSNAPPPFRRYDSSPTVPRYDPNRIRASNPYTNTETDKDTDAPSSPLNEGKTADEANRMDVEVVKARFPRELTGFPFRGRPHLRARIRVPVPLPRLTALAPPLFPSGPIYPQGQSSRAPDAIGSGRCTSVAW